MKPSELRLDEDAIALYKYAVAHPSWTKREVFSCLGLYGAHLDAAVRALSESRLFRPSLDPDRAWDAVGPQGAVVDLLADEEARVRREQSMLVKVREELLGLLPAYVEARRRGAPSESIDIVNGNGTVSRLFTEHAQQATEEVCIANPGSGLEEIQWVHMFGPGSPQLDIDFTAVRLILNHSTRNDHSVRNCVTRLDQHGRAVRTVPRVPLRLILFDRSIAFLPLRDPQVDNQVAVVRHPAVVETLLVAFELLWGSAQPFPLDNGAEDDGFRDHLRMDILRHLADGAKDEVIARRLGLSVRTCRRHIAAIMSCLGATSRFQAGVLAQRSMLGLGD